MHAYCPRNDLILTVVLLLLAMTGKYCGDIMSKYLHVHITAGHEMNEMKMTVH